MYVCMYVYIIYMYVYIYIYTFLGLQNIHFNILRAYNKCPKRMLKKKTFSTEPGNSHVVSQVLSAVK